MCFVLHGLTFQPNCKFSEHVRLKLTKANKCLHILSTLRKELFGQKEIDHLIKALVLSILMYGLPVSGASDSNLNDQSAYETNFFISLFGRALKMIKNGVYFIVIALLVAELFKILIYAN